MRAQRSIIKSDRSKIGMAYFLNFKMKFILLKITLNNTQQKIMKSILEKNWYFFVSLYHPSDEICKKDFLAEQTAGRAVADEQELATRFHALCALAVYAVERQRKPYYMLDVKVEKRSEVWDNATPFEITLSQTHGDRVQRVIEIIWYFRNQYEADERCPCARPVEMKRRVMEMIWYLKGALSVEKVKWNKKTHLHGDREKPELVRQKKKTTTRFHIINHVPNCFEYRKRRKPTIIQRCKKAKIRNKDFWSITKDWGKQP